MSSSKFILYLLVCTYRKCVQLQFFYDLISIIRLITYVEKIELLNLIILAL